MFIQLAENVFCWYACITECCDTANSWHALLPYVSNKAVATIVYRNFWPDFRSRTQFLCLLYVVKNNPPYK